MSRIMLGLTVALSTILVTLSFCPNATAERGATANRGGRVRVHYEERVRKWFLSIIPYSGMQDKQMSGELVSNSSDSISIRDDQSGDTHTFGRDSVERLDVSVGSYRRTIEGLGYGFSIGFFVAYGYLAGYRDYEDAVRTSATTQINRAAAIFGIATLAGGIIGYHVKTDRWKKIEIENLTIGADLYPNLKRPSVILTLRF